MEQEKVMAMYDVRGIQDYIFRTAKIRDAIGASAIVEDIIGEALKAALKKLGISGDSELEWCTEDGPLPYRDTGRRVQVLYIGGGNAFLICESRELCRAINRIMAKYMIESTYSLQLAAAMTEVKGDYGRDYGRLMCEMSRVKAEMVVSKPLGALPVMDVEIKTGYPASADPELQRRGNGTAAVGTESLLKLKKEQEVRAGVKKQMKILDNYTTRKGTDSTIAVIHIDGNNMGLRIRSLIEGIESYEEAVNRMRAISYHISSSYRDVFEDVQRLFSEHAGKHEQYAEKKTDDFVLKILTAGDDITYVCNGAIALATVEHYCREITKYTLTGDTDEESIRDYGFSVCAGIAYIGSHFPFYAGYEVAEACCESAKSRAKAPEHMDGSRIGNWVDFHICKNIRAQDLKAVREKEYVTSHGERLLVRPYMVSTGADGPDAAKHAGYHRMDVLKKNIRYFQDEKNIPRSFAKNLRNLYSQGKDKSEMFLSFLESRNWEMPDKSGSLYFEKFDAGEDKEPVLTAKWYDALELLDDYIDLDEIVKEENDEPVSAED